MARNPFWKGPLIHGNENQYSDCLTVRQLSRSDDTWVTHRKGIHPQKCIIRDCENSSPRFCIRQNFLAKTSRKRPLPSDHRSSPRASKSNQKQRKQDVSSTDYGSDGNHLLLLFDPGAKQMERWEERESDNPVAKYNTTSTPDSNDDRAKVFASLGKNDGSIQHKVLVQTPVCRGQSRTPVCQLCIWRGLRFSITFHFWCPRWLSLSK